MWPPFGGYTFVIGKSGVEQDMSEPVTQAEIEDVLSSIRRLVSEDAREAQAESKSAAAEATPVASDRPDEGKSAPRLVLTPALRVLETADAGEDDAGEDDEVEARIDPSFETDDTAETADRGVLDSDDAVTEPDSLSHEAVEKAASFAAATGEDRQAREHATEQSEDDAPWKDPWATLYQAAGVQEAGTDVFGDDRAAVPEPVWEASERVSAVVQKITELEAKVAQSKQQWEPDGLSSDPYAGSNIETLQWQDHVEDEAAEILSGFDPDGAAHLADGGLQHPESETQDDFADEAYGDQEQEAEMAEKIVEEAVASEAFETLSGDDAFLDEESLREMVADIVREELQGALGERITRNVRKLVRREIHRALAAQDLL